MFGILDHPLELFLVFNILGWSVNIKVKFTIIVLPTLGMPSDIDNLWMPLPYPLHRVSKIEDTYFKWLDIWNIASIDWFDNSNEFLNEQLLFIAVLTIVHFLVWKYSSIIGIVIVREVWSDVRCHSGWIKWLLNSSDPNQRNIKLMTKFESWLLSEYLIGTWLVSLERSKLNESVIFFFFF